MSNALQDTLQQTLGTSYVLERELGGGGMSRVFVATETALDRRVVIKVLPPDLAAGVNVERFRREIALAARLQHPHIVPLLTAGDADGLPFFTMPFIDGESLRSTLDRTGELPINVAVRHLREVASALAYAHANGVVHRDIKPDNVLISGGSAMVTDFGVAKALRAAVASTTGQLTGLGVALGTPAYMAPEQAAADPAADARADIYAFGAMAYELLTGQPPFSGRPAQAMLAAHAVEPPEPVDRRRPAVPPQLASLVMSCLQKRPADRPQTASLVVQALDSVPTTPQATGALAAYQYGSGSTWQSTGGNAAAGGGHARRWRIPALAALAALGVLAVVGGTLAIVHGRSSAGDGRAGSAGAQPKLVVLPFTNEGPANTAYFADGLTEAITNRLASLQHLAVIDPRSANQYRDTKKTPREIGRDLGVQYLLEGTVRWASGPGGTQQVQISPTLVNTADETTKLAPGPYVVQPSDVFRVQTDVASKVADALGIVLGATDEKALTARPTKNADAYDAFMRARDLEKADSYELSPTRLRDAMALYERAVQLDPTFALALAHLGEDRTVWAILDIPDSARARAARAAIDSALRLDPTLAEAHRARAEYLQAFGNHAREAYDELVRAQAERPNDAGLLGELGRAQINAGRVDEGIANLERAVQLDPRSVGALASAAQATFLYRRYAEATRYADQLIALAPDNALGYGFRAQVATMGFGDTATAHRIWTRERAAVPHLSALTFLVEESTQGSYDWARLEALQLADVHPEQVFDTVNFYLTKMDLYTREQRAARARAYADTALGLIARRTFTGPFAPAAHQVEAVANAVAGHRAAALQAIAAVKADESQGDAGVATSKQTFAEALAAAYVALGQADSAIVQVRRMLSAPTGKSAAYLRVDPEWDPLRADPRFRALLE